MPFKHPRLNPDYTSSPQKPTIYSGPDIPNAYDSNWQYFRNLTHAQIVWFQSQPEWQNFLAYVALSPKTATIATPAAIVDVALAMKPLSLNG